MNPHYTIIGNRQLYVYKLLMIDYYNLHVLNYIMIHYDVSSSIFFTVWNFRVVQNFAGRGEKETYKNLLTFYCLILSTISNYNFRMV